MKRVRLNTSVVRESGALDQGKVYNLENKFADTLVAAQHAEYVEKPRASKPKGAQPNG